MSDQSDQSPQPDIEQAPGWFITDPDGNVVASGPVSHGIPVLSAGEADSEPAEGE